MLCVGRHPALCAAVRAFCKTEASVGDADISRVVSVALPIINVMRSEGMNPCQL